MSGKVARNRQAAALKAFTRFSKAHTALGTHLAHAVDLPPILQGSGFPILEVLLHKGSLSQCEIGRRILRTTGNISQALDKLEGAGLVRRAPGPDRRTHTIELTTEGRALIEEWFPRMAASIEAAFQVLDADELEQFSSISKKLGIFWQDA